MFLTQGNAERGRLSPFQYGTAGTTTTTTLASSGGLLINIDSATGDIARNSNGWLENNEALGWYINRAATNVSVEADTAVMLDGHKTLKLTVDASGRVKAFMYNVTGASGYNQKYMKPAKPSTKYKITCKVKTTNVATNSAFLLVEQFNSALGLVTSANTTALTGTNDFTNIVYEVTTSATTSYISINPHLNVAGNASDAWFGVATMTFDEVIEPVANSLTTPSPSLVSFTAVGSVDNIDQSLDPTFVAANTYTPPVAISEAATDKQTFVPTKTKTTRIGVYPVAKGTGNWSVVIHDASNVVQGSLTIANASLTNGVVNYFNIPCNLTAAASYHFHVTSTVADGTVRVGTAADLETCSYIQNYYKPTTNFKASQNNSTVSISADEEGFLDGSVVNLTTGSYSFNFSVGVNPNPVLWSIFETNTQVYLSAGIAGRPRWDSGYFTYKINTPVLNSDLLLTYTIINGVTVDYSFDNSTWLNLTTQTGTPTTTYNVSVPATGQDTVYVRFTRTSGSVQAYNFYGSSTFDTSSLSTLRNYPTNKDVIKQYSTTLGSATTSATYRATKWGFPAIEYNIAGLIGRYDMFGNANDTSGSGFNGTVTGATLTTDRYGNANRAYLFNGTTDYISMGDVMDVGTGDLSFSIWFKTTTSGVTQGLLTKSKFAGGNGRYGIQFIAGELYSFIDFDTGASIWKISVPETHYVDGNWHQAVVTIKRTGNITLYVDGVNKGTTDISAQSAVDCSSTNIFGIGAYQNVAGTAFDRHFFTGSIGQVRIFNRELSQAEVTYMYTSTGEEQSQYLDVDTTATGSTVAFSELGTSYTTVADGASLAITSTSTPNIFVKTNITANRLYVSSNDYNASSDKDGSLKQSVVYNVIQ